MPGLELTYDDLRSEIGLFVGSGRASTDWDTTAAADIRKILASACRRFYYPTLNADSGELYRWSFLETEFTINLMAGKYKYDLPEKFAGLVDTLDYAEGSELTPLSQAPDRS